MTHAGDHRGLDAGDGARDQAVVFSGLWALAHVGHVLRKSQPSEPIAWLLLLAALLLLIRPSASRRLAGVAVAQLLYLADRMPVTDNHAYLLGFANLGLSTALVASRGRGFRLPVPYLVLTLLLSYGAAAVAKLNAGFFDVGVSCAVEMLYDAVAVAGLAPGSLRAVEPVMPFLIAAIELTVPLALLLPRTRRAAVVLVVLFHWGLSLSPTATAIDFTLVVYSLVFLALPAQAATRIRAGAARVAALLPAARRARIAAVALLAAFLAVSLVTGWGGPGSNRNWLWLALAALAVGSALIVLALGTRAERSAVGPLSRPGLPILPYAALVLVQLANIGAPYLGIKTSGSFVMYSNLQTERGQSNHFLIPRLPRPAPMDDLVEVVASSNRELGATAASGDLVSWHELRRDLSRDPEASISYRRGGVLHVHEQAREDPELVARDFWRHKLIGHRSFDPRRASCRW